MNFVSPSRRQNPELATSTYSAPELISPRIFLAAAFCLAGIVFAVYSPALDFQFILDDHRFTADPRIQFSGHVWDYFSNYVWAQFTGGPPSFYRPLFILWMRLNFMLSALSAWGWHFTSIIAHVAVAALLGLLVWRLLRDRAAALLAASLFALHPAQAESVAWVTVPDPLMSACILGAIIWYRKYAATPRPSQPQGKRSRKSSRPNEASAESVWVLAASVSLYFLALLAKETAIVVPVIIFALALLTPQNNTSRKDGKEADSKSVVRLRRAIGKTVPFAGVTAIYLLLRFHAFGGKFGSLTQHLPWNTVLLSWPATLWFYVKVLVWPAHSHAFADPTLADRFSFDGVLLPGMAVTCFVAILAAVCLWAWRKAEHERSDREASGVEYALIIGTLLLVLPILPALHLNALNPGDFLHGRYTYLPSAGLMVLVATAWHLSGKLRVPLLCAAGLLATLFGVLTVSQERQWKDDLTVFTVAHDLAPHNAPVAQNLANAHVQAALQLADDGRCNEAIPVFQQVTLEYPQDWYAWASLGVCFVELNDLVKAEESLHHAADISHDPRVTQQWQELRTHMGLPPAPARN